jgi:hypothetical protein
VNFCVSSGISVLAVFVSFLCAILASAFYKYTTSREQMSFDDITSNPVNQNNDDLNKPITVTLTTESSIPSFLPITNIVESSNTNSIESLAEIEIYIEENTNENENEKTANENENENEKTINENENEKITNENEKTTNGNENENENEIDHEQASNTIVINTVEGSEEEIQKQQIANIYRLLNDQHLINNWTTTDFLDQLKMYGLHTYDEDEPEVS